MERKREQKRGMGGGQLGVRVPPVKLNLAQRHRCTQIPGIRSASQRPMILWSINATLGVGTPQILIKNEPVNDFLPCFKVPNDMKKKEVCVYVWSSVAVSSPSLVAPAYGSAISVWICSCPLTCSRAGPQTTKGCPPSVLHGHKAGGPSKQGGSCSMALFLRRRFDQSHL